MEFDNQYRRAYFFKLRLNLRRKKSRHRHDFITLKFVWRKDEKDEIFIWKNEKR
jgi:hypothetical protein